MATAEGRLLGFSDAKIERRRPSKRQTTLRTFSIVRNWESKEAQPVKTPIKEDANEQQQSVSSPVFPPPTSARQSLEVALTLTGDTNDAENSLTVATDVSVQPGEESNELHDTNHNSATSIVVDEATPSPMAVPGTPEHQVQELHDTSHSPATSVVVDEATATSIVVAETTSTSPMAVPGTPEGQVQVTLQVPVAISPREPVSSHQDTMEPAAIVPASPNKDSQPPRVTRGRKRKQDKVLSEDTIHKKDADEDEDDDDDAMYSDNNFVRIFNADQGRKITMGEITALDVVLTAIEELALEYRKKAEYGDDAKQSIKEFFVQVRKSFCECIDIQKNNQTLKSDYRKVNSKIKKLRGELLDVQKKRARIQGELKKYENQEIEEMESEKNKQDVLDISEYLHQVENLHKSCKKIAKESDIQDNGLASNLPSLLSQTRAMFNSVSTLQSMNSSLQQLLCI